MHILPVAIFIYKGFFVLNIIKKGVVMKKEIEELILKFALQNAVKFKGKASPGAIIGKLLGDHTELKKQMKEIGKEVNRIVKTVNSMKPDNQIAKLQEIAPEMLVKKEKKERDIFEFLNLPEGPLTTGFPPGPEKYTHLGHAKSLAVNYELAKKHKGKFILRFEDTNPATVIKKFYDMMLYDYKWLGASWDKLIYASDHMEMFYKKAEQVIKNGLAYMCFCEQEKIKENRMKSEPCKCRDRGVDENLQFWKTFSTYNEGKAVLRFKIDLSHKNSTMRDPIIFRIIDKEHPRLGRKYRVWPNYDFQSAIMDSYSQIDIRIRTKEFEMRTELQRWIQEKLGLKITKTYEAARFNLKGVPSSGRKIRQGIEDGEFMGWDDPRLTTLAALRRRGYQPKAIWDFVLSTGINKTESELTFDDLSVFNRRLLDRSANRYFFIYNPKEIIIRNAPEQNVEMCLHPSFKERGCRDFLTGYEFLISSQDYDRLVPGKVHRLMDCINFIKKGDGFEFVSTDHHDFKDAKNKGVIIHWLPKNYEHVDVEIFMPDTSVVNGIAEQGIRDLSVDNVIQFERFGFCRLDEISDKEQKIKFWFTHK